MDVSSLATALNSVSDDTASERDETPFVQLVQKGLHSPDASHRQSSLEALLALVTDGDESQSRARQETVFGDHALDYLPLLISLHTQATDTVRKLTDICLEVCSAREAILALCEAAQGIEERLFGYAVSDDGEMPEEDSAQDEESERDIPDQLVLVLDSLKTAFSRMPKIKSTPTLLTFADSLSSVLSSVAASADESQAGEVIRSGCEMIDASWNWIQQSTDVGGEQRAILSQLFYLITLMFGPMAQSDTLKRWFANRYPRYSSLHPVSASSPFAVERPLTRALRTAHSLSLDTQNLLDNVSSTTTVSRVSPHASFASLILLSDQFASSATPPNASSNVPLPPISDVLVLLSAALSSTAVDAGLTYTWETVARLDRGQLDLETTTQLVELLFPISATNPDPLIRLAVWKLVEEIIGKVSRGEDQIALLKQLLEPANPFIQIRIQAFSLLRRELAAAAREKTTTSILSPSLISTLPLLPHPTETEFFTSPITSADDLLGPQCTLLTERLVLLRYLHDLDSSNASGARSDEWRAKVQKEAVEPAHLVLARLRELLASHDTIHEDGHDHGLGRDGPNASKLADEDRLTPEAGEQMAHIHLHMNEARGLFEVERLEEAVKALER